MSLAFILSLKVNANCGCHPCTNLSNLSISRLQWTRLSNVQSHRAGAIVVFLEVRAPTEDQKALVHRYASFMHSFVGRGACEFIIVRFDLRFESSLCVGRIYRVPSDFKMLRHARVMCYPSHLVLSFSCPLSSFLWTRTSLTHVVYVLLGILMLK